MSNNLLNKQLVDEMIDFRRWMHQNPELSEAEENTAAKICEMLKKHNIEYTSNVGGYGVVAIIRGENPGKTVAAKADIDALPIEEKGDSIFKSKNIGNMHACGHDANTAILLGTAIYLKEKEKEFSGNVKLFFEPAEETIGGGEQMVAEGCMENPRVEKIIGLHVMPYLNTGMVEVKRGCLNASTNEVEITVTGKGGHAAEPESCIDPIVAMSYVITALQTFVSRNTRPTQSAVLSFGMLQSGTKGNIIPPKALAKGTLRTLKTDQREFAKKRVKEIAELTAEAFGAQAEVSIIDSYDAVINNDEIIDIIIAEADKLVGKDNIVYKEEPSMGAEDFSYYTKKAQGAYFHVGCKDPNELEICSLHTDGFHLDEGCIERGIEIQSAVLIRMLE